MSEPFLGEIRMASFGLAPRGWAHCDGQVLPTSQNQALFMVLGDAYGGNGVSTFALPDLRSRVPIGAGNGPGLSPRALGERELSKNPSLGYSSASNSQPYLALNFIIAMMGIYPSQS